MIAVIILRNMRAKNQIITVVKVMTRLMSVRKSSNTICTRLNVETEIRESSAKMMKMMKMVIKWERVVNRTREPEEI